MNKTINIAALLILLLPFYALGQFGKNKVTYKNYDWYFIQTDHCDIYFNQGGETLTEFTAQEAENALESIQSTFNYRINNRLTIIIYNSQNDFQETNVIDQYLSEGIQGFTELFKNRVVIQFTGSYKQYRHLIHHELVHAVMNDMFYGGSIQNIISNNITLQFPLWFSEGLAEYEALGWDVDTDMFLRDLAISENLPDINRLGGYLAYRGGQSVFYYIANKYGSEKIGELLNKIKGIGNVNEGFKATIGIDINELGERWSKEIKKRFWPDIAIRDDAESFAKRLTDPKNSDGFYNTSPALSPQGDKIAFISDRDFYFDVYIMSALDGKIIKKLVSGSRSPDFEELNILTPGLSWSPEGDKIAISAKSSGYDVIYIINVESEDRETLPVRLEAISSVTWSPDGKYLAFVGQNNRQSDIYVYNFGTKQIQNLTNDIFSDSDPSWSNNSNSIYFSSDRGDILVGKDLNANFKIYQHDISQKDIYRISVDQIDSIERITDMPRSDETSAHENFDGSKLIFISDVNGINNIYTKPLISDTISTSGITSLKSTPITNSLTGLYQLSLSRDSKKLVFSTLYQSSFNLFLMNNPFEPKTDLDTLKPTLYIAKLNEQRNSQSLSATESQKQNVDEEKENKVSGGIRILTGGVEDTTTTHKQDDYSKYVFGSNKNIVAQSNGNDSLFNPTNNLDQNGDYLVNRYKVTFGPDMIYANAGYSTYYGFLGTTVLSFSDILGNHRLIGLLGLQIDLKNSDYGFAYYYLANRTDYGLEAFHTARFVNLIKGNRINLYRFRNYSFTLKASFPLNRFYRLEGGLGYSHVRNENLDDLSIPPEETNFIIPSLAFVHDNVLWGYTSPIEGTRYRFDLYGNPGIDDVNLSFYTVSGDIRTYLRFWTDYSFAIRLSGAYSGGLNAQRFFLGGIENWINRTYATSEIPIESNTDFTFLSVALPLRGYNYSQVIGTKYLLMNYELRFPLIRYLVPGALPVLFSNILGVAFLDAGTAWNNTSKLNFFTRNGDGNLISKDLLVGTGVGARVYFLYFLLRFDVAWAYNFDRFSAPKFYFSIGADF